MSLDVPPSSTHAADPSLDYASGSSVASGTFWQKRWVQNVLPLLTSVTFHACLIVIGILGYQAYRIVAQPLREQVIVPEAAIVEGQELGGIPNPGLGGDPNLAAAQNVDPRAVSQGWADKRSESLTTTLMGGATVDSTDSIIGLGAHSGASGPVGRGTGEGSSAGGPLAPFGVPGGGQGLGPKSPFMGISGNAKRVIYICDASGSMMSVFWRVKDELHKAVDVLKPIQAFNVVFFSDVDVAALSKSGLVMANPDNKRKAFDLSDKMSASGTTDPLPAIRLAFEQKPELIYVLTDGFDQVVSFDAVVAEFRRLNPDKKVKVNTILIKAADNPELERVVKAIASENGGICRIIDRQSM